MSDPDLLIVGAGLFGLTVADHVARILGRRVRLIDSRDHVGGNAYSSVDHATGIEVHRYGAHLFHTSNERVWQHVNRFTQFTNYQHRVWTTHRGETYPMPIGLATINQFYELALTPNEARTLVQDEARSVAGHRPANLEEKAISLIGRRLYNAFIRDYTAKQWETDPRLLPPEIITRLPVRYNFDTRYFTDTYEGLPVDGYGTMLERMADHPLIDVELGTDFFTSYYGRGVDLPVIYTGPVDRYFNHEHGQLGWRTLDFEQTTYPFSDWQGCSVMNYADSTVPYTRTIEFKHFHPERREVFNQDQTIVAYEYSRLATPEDEPYYPVNTSVDREMLQLYRDAIAREPNVLFGGRLGTYQYLDMHMAIAAALSLVDNQLDQLFTSRSKRDKILS